jgi:hypothetical protein
VYRVFEDIVERDSKWGLLTKRRQNIYQKILVDDMGNKSIHSSTMLKTYGIHLIKNYVVNLSIINILIIII